MTRANQSLTLSLSPEDKAALEQIALAYGCTWGRGGNIAPNITGLLRAIANGNLVVTDPASGACANPALRKKLEEIVKFL